MTPGLIGATVLVAVLAGGSAAAGAAARTASDPVWQELSPAASPPPLRDAGMAYDSTRDEIVLFGGAQADYSYSAETWSWDGAAWTKLAPNHSPPALFAPAMAYDEGRDQLLLIGGTRTDHKLNEDTWLFRDGDWSLIKDGNDPVNSENYLAAYDQKRKRVVRVAEMNFGDTYMWNWTGSTWHQQQLATSPPGRYASGLAYDPSRRALILYGGTDGHDLGDTWSFDGHA